MAKMSILVWCIVAAVGSGATANELIVNGGFEVGPNPGGFLSLSVGSQAVTGWTVTRQTVDYIGSHFQPASGSRCLDLGGSPSAGGVMQEVPTVPGRTYRIDFMMAGNPNAGPTVKQMQIRTGLALSPVFEFNITGHSPGNMGWEARSWNFTAEDAVTEIEFFNLISSNAGPALDDVSIQDEPVATERSTFGRIKGLYR